ncbi:merR regulatory family protein [Synechococcus sp. RS9909]|nr:merR regulatory family protein [Synechococcus sp. RS9909]
MLQARRSGLCTCADLQATIRDKVTEIHQRIDDLRALEHDLNTLLAGWESCGGR